MAHTYNRLLFHVVFSTKARAPCISGDVGAHLLPYVGGIVRQLGGSALAVGGTSDHVHILLSLGPARCLSDVVRVVKTNSSRWVHEKWPSRRDFGWQAGYGAFTVSESNRETVSAYIADQQEHHRQMSFHEEFLAMLQKHGIDFEERFARD